MIAGLYVLNGHTRARRLFNYLIKVSFVLAVILFSTDLSAQLKLGGDPNTIDDGSILELESTNQGFVMTRMTTAERNTIPTPLTGMIIFNTEENCVQVNLGPPENPFWECLVDFSLLQSLGLDSLSIIELVGPAGPQGATGPAGPQGAQGATGPAGPAGPAGPNGNDGSVGPAGPQGATGPAGAQGPAGPQGATGAAGPAGPAGPNGNDGSVGPAGPQGCLLYTSPSPRDQRGSRMPSSA